MKRTVFGIVALLFFIVIVPAAFAGDDVAGAPRFNPSLRVGCAFDAAETHYAFNIETPGGFGGIGGVTRIDVTRPSEARFYLGTELPFAVTDRLTVAVGADWAFTGAENEIGAIYSDGLGWISWDRDGRSDWVTADFLVSYALLKDTGIVKELSAVAGVRWDYQTMALDNPHNVLGINSGPGNTVDFRMQRLAPVFGIDCTFTGIKSDIWGGDVKLGVLAGPVVWGTVDYRESFATPSFYRMKGDLSHGYIVRVSGEATVLSGPIAPGLDASLSLFVDYTHSTVNDQIRGTRVPLVGAISESQIGFETTGDIVVFGLDASLAFDLWGRPKPVSPAPAPAPPIEPKIEPMSQN